MYLVHLHIIYDPVVGLGHDKIENKHPQSLDWALLEIYHHLERVETNIFALPPFKFSIIWPLAGKFSNYKVANLCLMLQV